MSSVRPNKSAARTVEVLEFISQRDKPVSMADICRELGFPKSSTFELVYTLVEKGFLDIADANLKTFKLGMKLFQVGVSYVSRMSLHGEAKPVIENLMLATGMTVFMAVEHQGKLVYLDKVEPPGQTIKIDVSLGSNNPMHCTGLGKALLATYSKETVKEITGGGVLAPKTSFSIPHHDQLIEDLEQIRKRGYAIDNMENELNIVCIAAPIYDRLSHPVAAISIRSLASTVDDEQIASLSRLVTDSALLISQKLGFLKKKLYFFDEA